jgi:hypothetical protein
MIFTISDPRIDAALRLRYTHSLFRTALSNTKTSKFMLVERPRSIKFDETRPYIDLSQSYDVQSQLKIGDRVNIHSALLIPWDTPVTDFEREDRDVVSGVDVQIVAFVALEGKCGRALIRATFAVLSQIVDGAGSNPGHFVMTGKDQDHIALYFVGALEKVLV